MRFRPANIDFLPLLILLIAHLAGAKSSKDDSSKSTVFNGVKVPPIKDLNGTQLAEEVANGYWLIKAFSPWCTHCTHLAPKWQTIYEFYYTSDPVPASDEVADSEASLNSFSRYYNFKFGNLDCVAYGSACVDANVEQFPTLILLKNGEEIKRSVGNLGMQELSRFIEESLELIRPGSRPSEGVAVPKVGASKFDAAAQGKTKGRGPSRSKTTTKVSPVLPTTSPANPSGISKVFNAESFQEHVTRSLDPWFVKFYAPWCPHCKAMAPSWDAMAREMKGKLNIGEVNCDVERRLCRDAHVSLYPTIELFRGPERVEYEGLRGLGDLISYAESAAAAVGGVPDITLDEFEELESTEEVIFVWFYDHATTVEDFQALERLPIHVTGHAKVVKTKDLRMAKRFRVSTWPRLLVSRSGKSTVYQPLMPQQMRDVPRLIKWMRNNWLPLVPELTSSNVHEIMDGKFVVLGILNRHRSDEFTIAKREIKNAAIEWIDKQQQAFELERQELRDAKQLRIEEAEDRRDKNALRDAKLIRINMDEIHRKEVAFAWVDGLFWERWIRTTFGISVVDGERVVMYDLDNHRYWDNTITGNPIVPSRTSILETLPKVVVSPPKLVPKATGSSISHFFFRIRKSITDHPLVTTILFIGSVVGVLIARRHFRVPSVRLTEKKEGLLGLSSQPNGKVD